MTPAPRGTVTTGKMPECAATAVAEGAPPRSRSAAARFAVAALAGFLFFTFVALGTWQVKRLQWKLDLIERVTDRVHALPVAAPGPAQWSKVNAKADEYRHVHLSGTYLYEFSAWVQASTDLGSGFWVMTPLRREDGSVVMVNRGFIPVRTPGQRDQADTWQSSANPGPSNTPVVPVNVTGLLRMSEPGGGFLRHNDPAANRWYSRDVQAIAAARGLSAIAPYFVDADAVAMPGGAASGENFVTNPINGAHNGLTGHRGDDVDDAPIGGLTVIAFHNNHLMYAITWYVLALMTAGAGLWVAREDRRLLRANKSSDGIDGDSSDRKNEDGNQN
ncbi:SURF1 family protein [Glaciimonas immobilis]|uniref:SURF1-like protein n=1 Tax=Glaciimonas immobilis TaxID=728004 RepID=A0A840RX59_9BURK|nr:SURF1 family protein [Glaciimonas immobilis]KAF3996336.1 SURF1 family protein [Glaciimonas immobilis]MBB5202173.1 surfeit locus 1 family protein [Glaciimonas immobilis]